jgi:hypothetical protein
LNHNPISVLQKSELQQLQEEVLTLRGYFGNSAEHKAIVQRTTERVKQRFATDGSSKAIRERRQAVLLTLISRLSIDEPGYTKYCESLMMQRLLIALQTEQVKKDYETAEEEDEEEIRRFERAQRALELKADNHRAALAKQQRKLEAAVASLPPVEAMTLPSSAAMSAHPPSRRRPLSPRRKHTAHVAPDEESDHEETEEEARANALDDEQEAKDAAEDEPSAADRAFIAPEGDAH